MIVKEHRCGWGDNTMPTAPPPPPVLPPLSPNSNHSSLCKCHCCLIDPTTSISSWKCHSISAAVHRSNAEDAERKEKKGVKKRGAAPGGGISVLQHPKRASCKTMPIQMTLRTHEEEVVDKNNEDKERH